MKEQQIQKKILDYLSKLPNTYVFKVISANRKGIPDIIACIEGRFYGIEVKTPEGKVTELQGYNLRKIEEAGGVAIVARSVENMIEGLINETK